MRAPSIRQQTHTSMIRALSQSSRGERLRRYRPGEESLSQLSQIQLECSSPHDYMKMTRYRAEIGLLPPLSSGGGPTLRFGKDPNRAQGLFEGLQEGVLISVNDVLRKADRKHESHLGYQTASMRMTSRFERLPEKTWSIMIIYSCPNTIQRTIHTKPHHCKIYLYCQWADQPCIALHARKSTLCVRP